MEKLGEIERIENEQKIAQAFNEIETLQTKKEYDEIMTILLELQETVEKNTRIEEKGRCRRALVEK